MDEASGAQTSPQGLSPTGLGTPQCPDQDTLNPHQWLVSGRRSGGVPNPVNYIHY